MGKGLQVDRQYQYFIDVNNSQRGLYCSHTCIIIHILTSDGQTRCSMLHTLNLKHSYSYLPNDKGWHCLIWQHQVIICRELLTCSRSCFSKFVFTMAIRTDTTHKINQDMAYHPELQQYMVILANFACHCATNVGKNEDISINNHLPKEVHF